MQEQKEMIGVFEKAGAIVVKAPSVAFEITNYLNSFYTFKSMFLVVNFSGAELIGEHIFLYVMQKYREEDKKMFVATIAINQIKGSEIGLQIKK